MAHKKLLQDTATTDCLSHDAVSDAINSSLAWLDDYNGKGVKVDYYAEVANNDSITAAQAAKLPITLQPMLYGRYLRKGSYTIIAGSSNVGKSLFCYELAFCAATGKAMLSGEIWPNDCPPMRVLYFDFETSASQRKTRTQGRAVDNINFVNLRKRPLEIMLPLVMGEIAKHNAEMVIIDNKTTLCTDAQDTKLNALLSDFCLWLASIGLTVVVVAHTPKRANDNTTAATLDLLAGGHEIGDLAQNVLFIKQCAFDDKVKYIKQLKSRDDDKDSYVHTFTFEDVNGCITMQYGEQMTEKEALKATPRQEKQQMFFAYLADYQEQAARYKAKNKCDLTVQDYSISYVSDTITARYGKKSDKTIYRYIANAKKQQVDENNF